MTTSKFFNNEHFMLVVGFGTFKDNNVSEHDRKIKDTQSWILLEITKEETSKDFVHYIDGHVNVFGKSLPGVNY